MKARKYWLNKKLQPTQEKNIVIENLKSFKEAFGHFPNLQEYNTIAKGDADWPSIPTLRKVLGDDYYVYLRVNKVVTKEEIALSLYRCLLQHGPDVMDLAKYNEMCDRYPGEYHRHTVHKSRSSWQLIVNAAVAYLIADSKINAEVEEYKWHCC